MQSSQIPAKFPIPFANGAVAPYIRSIPIVSQIGIQAGAASLPDGFPPLTFSPTGAGGVPPFGSDFNGLLNQISAWSRWKSAGGPIKWDSAFSTAIGGYPLGAIVASATTLGHFWMSLAENNTTNPDSGGAGWTTYPINSRTTANRPGSPAEGDIGYNTTLHGLEFWNGTLWCVTGQQPTVQRLLSGSSATYTPTPGTARIRGRMAGGGGGGGQVTGGTAATAGGDTTFGGWVAKGGSPGGTAGSIGGLGGGNPTPGANGTGTLVDRTPGTSGGAGIDCADGQTTSLGGEGGRSALFGGGAPTTLSNTAGAAGLPNTGGGGAGGATLNAQAGTGGGGAESVEFWIYNPGTIIYTVGNGGNGGLAGGKAGGNGGTGKIIIEEFTA